MCISIHNKQVDANNAEFSLKGCFDGLVGKPGGRQSGSDSDHGAQLDVISLLLNFLSL